MQFWAKKKMRFWAKKVRNWAKAIDVSDHDEASELSGSSEAQKVRDLLLQNVDFVILCLSTVKGFTFS